MVLHKLQQKFVFMAMSRNGGPGGPPFKVNGFPVFPDPADEGNGKPEPYPVDEKNNMSDSAKAKSEPEINAVPGDATDNMSDQAKTKPEANPDEGKDRIDELIFEISEISEMITDSENQLQNMKGQERPDHIEEEVEKMKHERALLDNDLAQELILQKVGKIGAGLDFWETQILVGNNQTLNHLKEQEVEKLKEELDILLLELLRLKLNRKSLERNRKRREK